MFKRCKVVMLPTNEKANLYLLEDKLYKTTYSSIVTKSDNIRTCQNLYILSNDEIKEGDWILYDNKWVVQATTQKRHINSNYIYHTPIPDGKACHSLPEMCKKIIATTNESLDINPENLRFGYSEKSFVLPKPSGAFIEKYIKKYNEGKPITNVMVEYTISLYKGNNTYGTEVPRISPDNTITIKKVKDSWSREEVMSFGRFVLQVSNEETLNELFNKWTEENL